MGFLSAFTVPFLFALALWPVVSMALTVPVLAMLYHRDNRLGLPAVLSAYGTVLYAIGLLCFTLYPLPSDPVAFCAAHHLTPQLDLFRFIDDIRTDGLDAVLQIVMNVMFFLPLGFIVRRVFRRGFSTALVAGFLVSLLVETMQLTGALGMFPCAYRLFDVDDLAWNTSGALAGYGCALVFDRLLPVRESNAVTVTRPGLIRRLVAFLVDMGLVMSAALPLAVAANVAHALVSGSRPGADADRVLGGLGFSGLMFLLMLFVFEVLVPWLRDGRTLGGGYTHMTCETVPRSGARRVLFYMARFVAFACLTLAGMPWQPVIALALLAFWRVFRRMPYDLI
ncbi:VanZ family protein [Bifidobacterium callimiconis]|uniref:Teicoplanin resistance protein VanZ n=1 Tax=Bifidobacterium callimiconis TaxID=2306973 RepID=A0A430FHM0_9BIFI|nr:VanZ family protein [Bifidobacterium callimiconis]RSX52383.1 teicoplanin resistance protein VanZ [Bifidobacterium callimiconis]